MRCSRLATGFALLLAPTLLPAERDESEEGPVALMQLHWGLKNSSSFSDVPEDLNEPAPYGRTVLSTNPRATAEWMATYYDNVEMLPSFGECAGAERAAALLNLGFGKTQLMVFVKPKSSLGSDLDPNVMIPRIEKTVTDMFQNGKDYTSWFDNHDGFRANSFLADKAFEDGYNVGIFKHLLDSGSLTTKQYIMFFFPHTMYGIQNVDSELFSVPEGLPTFLMYDCRADSSVEDEAQSLLQRGAETEPHSQYWKATFMANNPATALDFAVKVLNASVGDSPYEWPVEEGCTGATWAQFPGSKFQLHFVNSNQYQTRDNTIKDFTDRVLSIRDLKAGQFDPYMYNSFIMTVKSLDPFVDRLRAQSIDYMLVSVGEGSFALLASIPDNDITFQLRSSHLSVEVPAPVDMCTQRFGDY